MFTPSLTPRPGSLRNSLCRFSLGVFSVRDFDTPETPSPRSTEPQRRPPNTRALGCESFFFFRRSKRPGRSPCTNSSNHGPCICFPKPPNQVSARRKNTAPGPVVPRGGSRGGSWVCPKIYRNHFDALFCDENDRAGDGARDGALDGARGFPHPSPSVSVHGLWPSFRSHGSSSLFPAGEASGRLWLTC